jgi:hypothetical protein
MTDLSVKSINDELREMFMDTVENPYTVMTFSDLEKVDKSGDAVEDLSMLHSISQMMIYNIMDYSPDKIASAKTLVKEYFDMANAILDESSGETTKEQETMLDKVKALFNDFKSKIGLKSRLEKSGHKPKIKESGLSVWKDEDGTYRWFARYSNNFRDDDNPSEIISKQSHINFVDMVDKGAVPLPELWHWHTKGTKWGQAEWVAFDEDSGIALAAGIVLAGHEKEAEALANIDEEIGVSHGMPSSSIRYDDDDKSVITYHITKEISDLPLWAAANKLTSFTIIKESEMSIPSHKKDYLARIGLSEQEINDIEEGNASAAKLAKDEGIESKEANAETTEPVTEETTEDNTEVTEPVTEKETEVVAGDFVTKEEFEDVVKLLTDSIADALKQIKTEIASGLDEVKAKQTQDMEESFSKVPTASLAAHISKRLSVVGAKETTVAKNTTLAKSGPDETPAQEDSIINSGNPVLDGVVSRLLGRS